MASTSHTNAPVAAIMIIVGLIAIYYVFFIWAVVRIIRRSGYSGWWVLAGLVPVFNVVMFFVFAFKRTPAERELQQLRAWAAGAGGPGRAGPWS